MPRFYFDFRDGERLVPDDEGVELPGAEEARREAALAVGGIARDRVESSTHGEFGIDVRDETGLVVARAKLGFSVE